ncbi:hypothetical protein OSTOST_13291, partial [Ostertagia ostertagi]
MVNHRIPEEEATSLPTAVWFVPNKESLKERKDYKRLPLLLPDVKIGYADCSQFLEVCRDLLDIRKLPQFVTFKTMGGYEIDYVNKPSYHEVSAFIKESIASPLHVLSVEEVRYSSEQWRAMDYRLLCTDRLRGLFTIYGSLSRSAGHTKTST